MKHYIRIVTLALTLPVAAFAQANLDSELARELDQLYLQQQRPAAVHVVAPTSPVVTAQATPSYVVQSAPTSVVAAPNVASPVVIQQQPTTLVEAAPLQESRADQARRRRQQQEFMNEQRIVEKLEEDRLRTEQERLNRVFPGNSINNNTNSAVTTAISTEQKQTVVTNPQQVVIVDDKPNRGDVINDGAIDDPYDWWSRGEIPYFSGSIGWIEYPDVGFIRSNMAIGMAMGKALPNNFVVEGSFTYSTHEIVNFVTLGATGFSGCGTYGCVAGGSAYGVGNVVEMQQYNFAGSVKYAFLSKTLRPFIGGVAGYTYRSYRDKSVSYTTPYTYNYNGYSHAFDLGLTGGLDVRVSRDFSIGFECRYMFNMKNWASSDAIRYMLYNGVDRPIENLNYYMFGLNLKFAF